MNKLYLREAVMAKLVQLPAGRHPERSERWRLELRA